MDKHELIVKFKELATELGRTPTYYEFISLGKTRHSMEKQFGNYQNLVSAAESEISKPPLDKQEEKLIKKYKALCGKKEQIQGFFRTTLDLADLFARAGNPSVLKVSAQPDTHAKFVDRPAFNCYLKFLKYYQPDVHLIKGDFVDCEGLSHWPDSSLEPRRIVPEMKIARQLLQEIIENTEKCSTRLYLTGNHEHWIEMALGKMPELFDGLAELDIEISLRTLLSLDKFGYQLFPLNELVQIGKAHFTHGIFTGTHHAKKHLDTFQANIFYGHLHDIQSHGKTSMDGPLISQSLGCLCRLDAKFLKGKPNNWNHAHGIFEFFPDGTFNYMVPIIFNGRMAYNGMVFDGNI